MYWAHKMKLIFFSVIIMFLWRTVTPCEKIIQEQENSTCIAQEELSDPLNSYTQNFINKCPLYLEDRLVDC